MHATVNCIEPKHLNTKTLITELTFIRDIVTFEWPQYREFKRANDPNRTPKAINKYVDLNYNFKSVHEHINFFMWHFGYLKKRYFAILAELINRDEGAPRATRSTRTLFEQAVRDDDPELHRYWVPTEADRNACYRNLSLEIAQRTEEKRHPYETPEQHLHRIKTREIVGGKTAPLYSMHTYEGAQQRLESLKADEDRRHAALAERMVPERKPKLTLDDVQSIWARLINQRPDQWTFFDLASVLDQTVGVQTPPIGPCRPK